MAKAQPGVIELRSVSKQYVVNERPMPVLSGLSLTIAPGEFLSIVGASDVGETPDETAPDFPPPSPPPPPPHGEEALVFHPRASGLQKGHSPIPERRCSLIPRPLPPRSAL